MQSDSKNVRGEGGEEGEEKGEWIGWSEFSEEEEEEGGGPMWKEMELNAIKMEVTAKAYSSFLRNARSS